MTFKKAAAAAEKLEFWEMESQEIQLAMNKIAWAVEAVKHEMDKEFLGSEREFMAEMSKASEKALRMLRIGMGLVELKIRRGLELAQDLERLELAKQNEKGEQQ